jgi:hypothetical protein
VARSAARLPASSRDAAKQAIAAIETLTDLHQVTDTSSLSSTAGGNRLLDPSQVRAHPCGDLGGVLGERTAPLVDALKQRPPPGLATRHPLAAEGSTDVAVEQRFEARGTLVAVARCRGGSASAGADRAWRR